MIKNTFHLAASVSGLRGIVHAATQSWLTGTFSIKPGHR